MRKFGSIAAIIGFGILGTDLLLRLLGNVSSWLWLPGFLALAGGSGLLLWSRRSAVAPVVPAPKAASVPHGDTARLLDNFEQRFAELKGRKPSATVLGDLYALGTQLEQRGRSVSGHRRLPASGPHRQHLSRREFAPQAPDGRGAGETQTGPAAPRRRRPPPSPPPRNPASRRARARRCRSCNASGATSWNARSAAAPWARCIWGGTRPSTGWWPSRPFRSPANSAMPNWSRPAARFFREAETAGRLNHPNIVTIYDVGEERGLAYIAMEYLKGRHSERLRDDPTTCWSRAKCWRSSRRTADGLGIRAQTAGRAS